LIFEENTKFGHPLKVTHFKGHSPYALPQISSAKDSGISMNLEQSMILRSSKALNCPTVSGSLVRPLRNITRRFKDFNLPSDRGKARNLRQCSISNVSKLGKFPNDSGKYAKASHRPKDRCFNDTNFENKDYGSLCTSRFHMRSSVKAHRSPKASGRA
jgi:hypothetical protein